MANYREGWGVGSGHCFLFWGGGASCKGRGAQGAHGRARQRKKARMRPCGHAAVARLRRLKTKGGELYKGRGICCQEGPTPHGACGGRLLASTVYTSTRRCTSVAARQGTAVYT